MNKKGNKTHLNKVKKNINYLILKFLLTNDKAEKQKIVKKILQICENNEI